MSKASVRSTYVEYRSAVSILLLAFLLESTNSKHHVDGSMLFLEATLVSWWETLFEMYVEAVWPARDNGEIP